MQPIIPTTILALLAIGVCLLAGVWAVFSSLGRGRGQVGRGAREAAAHAQSACGVCGHASDPKATTCPECGTPYAVAGMATPALLVRGGAPVWLCALLLAVPAVAGAYLLYTVAYRAVPMVATPAPAANASRKALLQLAPTRGVGGAAGYRLTIMLDANGAERTTGAPPNERHDFVPTSGRGHLLIHIGGQSQGMMQHDFQSDRWQVHARRGSSSVTPATGSGLEAGVATLFAHIGLDQRPFADAEMHEAAQWFTYTHGDPPPNGFAAVGPAGESSGPTDTALVQNGQRSESLSYGTIAAPAPTVSPRALPAGLGGASLPVLLWIIGLVLLVRARRRVILEGAGSGVSGS